VIFRVRYLIQSDWLKLWTVFTLLLGCEVETGIRVEIENALDHFGVLHLGRDAHFPVFHSLLRRDLAELNKRRCGYRAGRMYSIPAMDEDRLTVVMRSLGSPSSMAPSSHNPCIARRFFQSSSIAAVPGNQHADGRVIDNWPSSAKDFLTASNRNSL
jgi:hypothetical protein